MISFSSILLLKFLISRNKAIELILDFEYDSDYLGVDNSVVGLEVSIRLDDVAFAGGMTNAEGQFILYMTEEGEYTIIYTWMNVGTGWMDLDESASIESFVLDTHGFTNLPIVWSHDSSPVENEAIGIYLDGVYQTDLMTDGSGLVSLVGIGMGTYTFENSATEFTITKNSEDIGITQVVISAELIVNRSVLLIKHFAYCKRDRIISDHDPYNKLKR